MDALQFRDVAALLGSRAVVALTKG